jgi:hypothetical protein
MKSGRPRLPDFLVIGAQKSATTTLYADLACQASICMSSVKEPSVLIRFEDPEEAARYYARLFEPTSRHVRFGEASTLYTQLPTYPGVAARARRLLGPDLRLLYVVRNPVERALSHHYHAYSRRRAGPDVNSAIRTDPAFVDHGRYAMQLEPWLAEFGRDAAHVVRFEDYVRDRPATVRRIGEFLAVPVDASRLELDREFNKSEGNRVAGWLRPLMARDVYKLWLRRAVPDRLRRRLVQLIGPRAPAPPASPRLDTIDFLIERLGPDAERLRQLLGPDAPSWDLDATRKKYAERSR